MLVCIIRTTIKFWVVAHVASSFNEWMHDSTGVKTMHYLKHTVFKRVLYFYYW